MNLNQITLPVTDIEKANQFYLAMGFKFESGITEQRYLWREALLKDPSDNKIKLYWAGSNRLDPPWRVEIID